VKFRLRHGWDSELGAPENSNLHCMFPGLTRMANGDLLALYVAGSDFESSDQLPYATFSPDDGKTWLAGKQLFPEVALPSGGLFSCGCKPYCLDDKILALGYGFERHDLDIGLSEYAEKFGHFPKCRNFYCTSSDCGSSWSLPVYIEHEYKGIECSGPAILDALGQLHFFGPPFVLRGEKQRGLNFVAEPGTLNWQEQSCFFEHEHIAPWECRACLLPNGRIWLVFWAYDLANEKHLDNFLVYSDDHGRSWSNALDSGIACQAANLLALPEHEDYMLMVGTRREGARPGIMLYLLNSHNGECLAAEELLSMKGLCNKVGNIEAQFANLRFGQPSLTQLDKHDFLLCYWIKIDGKYRCKCHQFTMSLP